MSWFRVDDHLHAHSKAVRAGTEAMGLWILAGSWAAAEESDGWVPAYMLTRLAGVGADELAERLVDARLWERAEHDGDSGYKFHQWDEHQPTRAQLEAKRAQARERMARARGGAVRANESRSDANPTRPDPTPTKTPAAKAADPEGFAEFWQACPRKVGRTAAAKAYAKALQSTDAATLLHGITAAASEWKAGRTEERFIPHPSTWLNHGRWADEHPTLTPDMPTVRVTARQCADGNPHSRHPWVTHDEQPHMCLGVSD